MANRIKLRGTSEHVFELGLTNKQVLDASQFTSDHTWVLPDSDGSFGYLLATDGNGALSWSPNAAVAADSTTPYYVPDGETWTNNVNRQSLFNLPITIDGTIVVDGILLEVD